jgi:hypothetical protein
MNSERRFKLGMILCTLAVAAFVMLLSPAAFAQAQGCNTACVENECIQFGHIYFGYQVEVTFYGGNEAVASGTVRCTDGNPLYRSCYEISGCLGLHATGGTGIAHFGGQKPFIVKEVSLDKYLLMAKYFNANSKTLSPEILRLSMESNFSIKTESPDKIKIEK